MNKPIPELGDPLFRGLVAAALNPELRSIAIFDATSTTLNWAAQNLELMLRQVAGDNLAEEPTRQVDRVWLSVVQTEEDLWGQVRLQDGQIEWQTGALAGGRGRKLRLVIIPDLTQLSMAAMRACVVLMGSETAHLERHGRQELWQPNLCWLAGCPSQNEEVGSVSPHLLDRFALRLSDRVLRQERDLTKTKQVRIQELMQSLESGTQQQNSALSPELIERLNAAKRTQSIATLASEQRVTDYFDGDKSCSIRRELALLRLAQVNARLEGATQISSAHVDLAARTICLQLSDKSDIAEDTTESDEPIEPETSSAPVSPSNKSNDRGSAPRSSEPKSKTVQQPVYAADTRNDFPIEDIPLQSGNPYPEDNKDVPALREASSLKLPFQRFRGVGKRKGTIIGVEPANSTEDLAIFSTIFEAAKYQKTEAYQNIRRTYRSDNWHGLVLCAKDLRQYRRAVVPEQMLAVAIDYTCLPNSTLPEDLLPWQNALLPYLQWAYVERASICLIQIGAANAENKLRAERVKEKSLLVPRIQKKLDEVGKGKATPLAHGLDLMLETLRHALQHGRNTLEKVVVVIITDGRGNVPLKVSKGGELEYPVGQLGIKDALKVAREIATLNQVETVVLNPQPSGYKDLPVLLAQALGAKIADITPQDSEEVERDEW